MVGLVFHPVVLVSSYKQTGFRYLPLHDSQMSPYMFSTLFVEVKVRSI